MSRSSSTGFPPLQRRAGPRSSSALQSNPDTETFVEALLSSSPTVGAPRVEESSIRMRHRQATFRARGAATPATSRSPSKVATRLLQGVQRSQSRTQALPSETGMQGLGIGVSSYIKPAATDLNSEAVLGGGTQSCPHCDALHKELVAARRQLEEASDRYDTLENEHHAEMRRSREQTNMLKKAHTDELSRLAAKHQASMEDLLSRLAALQTSHTSEREKIIEQIEQAPPREVAVESKEVPPRL